MRYMWYLIMNPDGSSVGSNSPGLPFGDLNRLSPMP